MSAPHLHALEDALSRRGWRIVAAYPGDDYSISASWELQRSGRKASLLIDFDGMAPDGDVCLPLEESYGCHVRGQQTLSLYFRHVNSSRQRWERELADFVRSLDGATST